LTIGLVRMFYIVAHLLCHLILSPSPHRRRTSQLLPLLLGEERGEVKPIPLPKPLNSLTIGLVRMFSGGGWIEYTSERKINEYKT
jgi:hypothetical protein